MEILELFKNEMIIAATFAIVELLKQNEVLKGKLLFNKIKLDDYKLVSLLTSLVLILLVKNLSLSEETILLTENVVLLVLPSLGYDYFYKPLVKPILDLFKK